MGESLILWICVATGGAFGALTRFGIGEIFRVATNLPGWVAIVVANLLGSFLIAVVYGAYFSDFDGMVGRGPESARELEVVQLTGLISTGFCGGLTTFSTYALDSLLLLQQGKFIQACVNVLFTLVFGLALVLVGATVMGASG